MLIRINDEFYIAANRIIKVTADYERSKVKIFTDDGQEHSISCATGNMGVYNRIEALVKDINKACD